MTSELKSTELKVHRRWFPWDPPLNPYLSQEPLSYGEIAFWIVGYLTFLFGGWTRD